MLIIGIDPGLGTTGYGAITLGAGRRLRLREAGVLRTDASLPLEQRLAQLHDDMTALLDDLHAGDDDADDSAARGPGQTVMAVEALYTKYEHPRTAIIMGHARGAILLAAAQHGIPVTTYQASRVKLSVTGHGAAPKAQVGRTIQRILGLEAEMKPVDVTDALAIAVCHANALLRTGVPS